MLMIANPKESFIVVLVKDSWPLDLLVVSHRAHRVQES